MSGLPLMEVRQLRSSVSNSPSHSPTKSNHSSPSRQCNNIDYIVNTPSKTVMRLSPKFLNNLVGNDQVFGSSLGNSRQISPKTAKKLIDSAGAPPTKSSGGGVTKSSPKSNRIEMYTENVRNTSPRKGIKITTDTHRQGSVNGMQQADRLSETSSVENKSVTSPFRNVLKESPRLRNRLAHSPEKSKNSSPLSSLGSSPKSKASGPSSKNSTPEKGTNRNSKRRKLTDTKDGLELSSNKTRSLLTQVSEELEKSLNAEKNIVKIKCEPTDPALPPYNAQLDTSDAVKLDPPKKPRSKGRPRLSGDMKLNRKTSKKSPNSQRASRSRKSGSDSNKDWMCSTLSSSASPTTHSPTRRLKPRRQKFNIGHDVLARWSDGLFYLGSVVKTDEKGGKCYVRFEDNSEYWILFKDLQKGAKEGDISCCVCQVDQSEMPNEIVLCDNCGLGYHQECHNPNIDNEVLKPDIEWCCRLCVFAAAVKEGGALKNGPDATALQKMKQTFPYDLHKLTWDAQHKTNVEQCYCYCGGPGEWYLKMLQCCRCKQWFHEACIQCLEYPLMHGDKFYLFVCSHCNRGPEYIKRLDMTWADLVHLILFNLTIQGYTRKYYDVDIIMEMMDKNWEKLQLHKFTAVEREERGKRILKELESNKGRFACGKEFKKSKSLYGLRMRVPPPVPTLILPLEGQVTEDAMKNLQLTGTKKVKRFVPIQCHSPIPLKFKRSMMEMDDSIAFKARKKLEVKEEVIETPKSVNRDYRGFTGTNSPEPKKKRKSLSVLIPPPGDFDGYNNPFKTNVEQNEEKALEQRKIEIMNYLYHSSDSDTASQSSFSSFSLEDPTKLIPTPPPSVTSSQSLSDQGSVMKVPGGERRGRKRKRQDDDFKPVIMTGKRKRVCVTGRYGLDQNVIDVPSQELYMDRIKSKIHSYLGTSDRLRKGEKYHVLAKRLTTEGKVQYLVHWQGLVPK